MHNLCILNKKEINSEYIISISKINMKNGSLEPFEKCEEINLNEQVIKIINLDKEYLILCENSVYSLKEELSN